MKVSFIIATLNEIKRLPPVIESIRALRRTGGFALDLLATPS